MRVGTERNWREMFKTREMVGVLTGQSEDLVC